SWQQLREHLRRSTLRRLREEGFHQERQAREMPYHPLDHTINLLCGESGCGKTWTLGAAAAAHSERVPVVWTRATGNPKDVAESIVYDVWHDALGRERPTPLPILGRRLAESRPHDENPIIMVFVDGVHQWEELRELCRLPWREMRM